MLDLPFLHLLQECTISPKWNLVSLPYIDTFGKLCFYLALFCISFCLTGENPEYVSQLSIAMTNTRDEWLKGKAETSQWKDMILESSSPRDAQKPWKEEMVRVRKVPTCVIPSGTRLLQPAPPPKAHSATDLSLDSLADEIKPSYDPVTLLRSICWILGNIFYLTLNSALFLVPNPYS